MTSEPAKIPTVTYAIPIRRKIGEKQQGTIKIGAQIIDVLSEGIYTSPENALKELVSNAYDSDATTVKIAFDPKKNALVVEDDGIGMDYADFDRNFTFITGSEKRDLGPRTKKFGREYIGKIGIGFVSASQLCEKMIVKSAKEGADTRFEAVIDWGRMRQQIREAEKGHREFYETSKYTLINSEKPDLKEHYTIIELQGLTTEIHEILTNKEPRYQRSWYFPSMNFAEIVEWIAGRVVNVEKELTPYWTFVINLASIIPVRYLSDGPIRGSIGQNVSNDISQLKKEVADLNFKVSFDGLDLMKPILLPARGTAPEEFDVFWFDEKLTAEDGTELKVKGYFYNQRGGIPVENWRGLVVRIKNTAVGGPDTSFMSYAIPGDKLYLAWTYGEVYAIEGLEDAMNINRSSFKQNHPHYRALREFVYDILKKKVFARARTRYQETSEQKLEAIQSAHEQARNKMIRDGIGPNYSVTTVEGRGDEPLITSQEEKKVKVFMRSPLFTQRKKEHRILLADVLTAFEAAVVASNGDTKKLREYFFKYLEEIPKR